MPLVYVPERSAFFHWGDDTAFAMRSLLQRNASPIELCLALPDGARLVPGALTPLLDTVARLAAVPAEETSAIPPSIGVWVLASKLALELVGRQRIVPAVVVNEGASEVRWAVALSAVEDADRLAALARAMPPSAHAIAAVAPQSGRRAGVQAWAPTALLRAFLDATADSIVRAKPVSANPNTSSQRATFTPARSTWDERWVRALTNGHAGFEPRGLSERGVLDGLSRWSEPAREIGDRMRLSFELVLPTSDEAPFVLRYSLEAPGDPPVTLPASKVWELRGRHLTIGGQTFRDPQETLLEGLGRAARVFAPLANGLADARPAELALDPAAAWTYLVQGAQALKGAGFGVVLPGEVTGLGQRKLHLRLRVGGKLSRQSARLGLDDLMSFEWEAAIGDDALTPAELESIIKQRTPLVQFRGSWVTIDPIELERIHHRTTTESTRRPAQEALRLALAGEIYEGDLRIPVVAGGALSDLLTRLRNARSSDALDDLGKPPVGLHGTLRPYQERGLEWLVTMGSFGLGACLADDMGLGKTVQLLAFLLEERERGDHDKRPSLVVAPTSVAGNWEREAQRFAPDLPVIRHDGPRSLEAAAKSDAALVITTYGLLRRHAEALAEVRWSTVVLDEAQNIKNSASATARAARTLNAPKRFALTGTPVENRLTELWSILEFANPGIMGSLETFRRDYAVPIEKYGSEGAAERLRRLAAPFILRRVKSDPKIVQDLPAKDETTVACSLTREQATLYKAVVDDEMRQIESLTGIERQGRVLTLAMYLKQICNHPAHYLKEAGPLTNRSGKLSRVSEMLEEALSVGDKALVFTQFREMGDRLVAHFEKTLGVEIAYLHGGTPARARDQIVRRFQEEPEGPRVFVLSLKAGGTGLNLTAANHVFHYDRWWNPAVEDQATDRAHRIGQRRNVQVHKLVCAGTVEEKIDRMLEQKRDLAARVVGSGERWITELDDNALRELFTLSSEAVVGSDEPEETVSSGVRKRPARNKAGNVGAPESGESIGPESERSADSSPRVRATASEESS
ncbi:MAG: DEAD/DEAH box helicase [Polyangiaceae bacterium]